MADIPEGFRVIDNAPPSSRPEPPPTPEGFAPRGQPLPSEPNFVERLGTKLGERVERVERGTRAYEAGEISYPELVTYGISFGVGALFDTVGEGVLTLLSGLTPDSAEEFLQEQLAAGGTALMNTETAQQAIEIYNSLSQQEKDRLANFVDIGLAMVPGGKRAGQAIKESGINAEKNIIGKYVLDQSYNANKRRATEAGLPAGAQTSRNMDEAVLNTVISIPGVSSSASRETIMKALNKELARLGKQIKDSLAGTNFVMPKPAVQNQIRKEMNDFLKANPVFASKSMQATVRKVQEAFDTSLKNYSGKPLDLLKLRQEFDQAVETLFKKDVHAGDDASRQLVAAMRNRLNSMMEELVPDQGVRSAMRRQHHILIAKDNLGYNMSREPKWWATAARKVEQHPMLTLGAATGGGGMFGSLLSSEAVGVGALGAAGLYGLTRPGVRQVAGQAMETLPVGRGVLTTGFGDIQEDIQGQ